MSTDSVTVIVNWPEAVQSGDPVQHIKHQATEKLRLQDHYTSEELQVVEEDDVCTESCREIAGRLHRQEEKRVRREWKYPDGTDDSVEEQVKVAYTRPATRGWMNRPVRPELVE